MDNDTAKFDGRIFKRNSDNYFWTSIKGRVVLMHRYVWEKANGPLRKGWVVHHRNGNRGDNRLGNLLAMTHSDHNTIHSLENPESVNELLLSWAKKPKSKAHMDKIRAAQLAEYKLPPTRNARCVVCDQAFKAYKRTTKHCSVACKSRYYRKPRKATQT